MINELLLGEDDLIVSTEQPNKMLYAAFLLVRWSCTRREKGKEVQGPGLLKFWQRSKTYEILLWVGEFQVKDTKEVEEEDG